MSAPVALANPVLKAAVIAFGMKALLCTILAGLVFALIAYAPFRRACKDVVFEGLGEIVGNCIGECICGMFS